MVAPLPPVRTQLSSQSHDYQQFSEQYSKLQIENTYFLAFRSVAELLGRYLGNDSNSKRTLDFGCGTGRSTRFLHSLGLDTVGVDINPFMLSRARQAMEGDYYLLDSEQLPFAAKHFDIIFQSFVLLEYSSIAQMTDSFEEFHRVLADDGLITVVTGSEDYYRHDWLSFEMGDTQEQTLESGCQVQVSIRGTDVVLFDYYWTDSDYRHVFQQTGLEVVDVVQPLAQGDEPFNWVNECEFPCWSIYVLKKQRTAPFS
ncbi:MAG: class I SAM-dependent methyltransferase [Thainema sp.]